MSRRSIIRNLFNQVPASTTPRVAYAVGSSDRSSGGNWVTEPTTPPTSYSTDAGKLAMFDVSGQIKQCGGMWFAGTLGTGRRAGFLENPFAADSTTYGVYWPAWTAGVQYMALSPNHDGSLHQADVVGLTQRDSPTFAGLTVGVLELAENVWDDLRFPAQAINPSGSTAPPTVSNVTGCLEFSGSNDNIIAGVAQLPHSWKEGTAVEPHLHLLFPTSASGKNTRWKLDYNLIPAGGSAANAYGSYSALATVTVANPADTDLHVMPDLGTIDMTGLKASSIILWRLTRLAGTDASDNDTSACVLLELDFHFQVDKVGSVDEYGDTRLSFEGELLAFEGEIIHMDS